MSDWGWPGVIAHRCGGALAPENTLAGLGIAARLRQEFATGSYSSSWLVTPMRQSEETRPPMR